MSNPEAPLDGNTIPTDAVDDEQLDELSGGKLKEEARRAEALKAEDKAFPL